jgi:hypothetical protein
MDFSTFIQDFFNSFARQIQLGLPCKIEKFDKKTMRADVQPFMKIKNAKNEETAYPILCDLPVQFVYAGGFYIRPAYARGDVVWVTFSTFDMSDGLNEYSRAESSKIFSLENACVSHAIASGKFTPPPEFGTEDGLIIGEKGGASYMVFASDSITMKFSNGAKSIKFDSTGVASDGEVVANNSLTPVHLSTHTHPFTPGLGGSSPTSSPTPGT